MQHQSPSPNRTRLYVITFLILGVLTMVEFAASTLGAPIKLPALLILATIKALLVAGIYMHLRFDSRIFSTLVLMGLFFAFIMVLTFTVVLNINWST